MAVAVYGCLAAVTWGITLTQATALTDWAVGTLPLNQCLTVVVDGLHLLKLPLPLPLLKLPLHLHLHLLPQHQLLILLQLYTKKF